MADKLMTYTSTATNTSIRLCAKGIFVDTTPFHSWEYRYKVGLNNLYGLRHETKSRSIDVHFSSKALADKARRLFERDIKERKPGIISCGEWSTRAYVVGAKKDSGSMLSYELTVSFIDGVWRRRASKKITESSNPQPTGDYLNYPYNYPYDYMGYEVVETCDSSDYFNSPIDIYFYGPCSNPFAEIEGNRYQVDVDIPAGCYVHIDGVKKEVTLTTQYGGKENVFSKAHRKENEYIFKPVPQGTFNIHLKAGITADVGWFEEDSELPWT